MSRNDSEVGKPVLSNLLDAMIGESRDHGWTEEALERILRRMDIAREDIRGIIPRGAADLAMEYHRRSDREMIAVLDTMDLSTLRFPDRIAEAVWQRCRQAAGHRLAVRALIAHFALPRHCAEGARLTWESSDSIWNYFGHTERDLNWYTKRMTLVTVLGSAALYLVGDSSDGLRETRAFIDRRIADVMPIESAKARVRNSRIYEPVAGMMSRFGTRVRHADGSRRGYSR